MGVPPMSEEPLLIGVAADVRRLKRGESESESERGGVRQHGDGTTERGGAKRRPVAGAHVGDNGSKVKGRVLPSIHFSAGW